jgi:hypothetical protein
MTRPNEQWLGPDDRQLDRLVDGELDETQRRNLLLQLDAEPDGWKRCAAAFLEAQCWQESFRTLALPEPVVELAPVKGPLIDEIAAAPDRLPQRGKPLRITSALAACFVSAFGLGLATGKFLPSGASERAPAFAAVPAVHRVGNSGQVDAGEQPLRENPALEAIALVNLDDEAGSKGQALPVPLFSGPGASEVWLQNRPSVLSEYTQSQLQKRGFQVQQNRYFVESPLKDGRRVKIPIDELKYRFVGTRPS